MYYYWGEPGPRKERPTESKKEKEGEREREGERENSVNDNHAFSMHTCPLYIAGVLIFEGVSVETVMALKS